jgi:hypothetical protein
MHMDLCMCVCTCIHRWVSVYSMHMCMYVCTCMHVTVGMYGDPCKYVHACESVRVRVYVCVCTCVRVHASIRGGSGVVLGKDKSALMRK